MKLEDVKKVGVIGCGAIGTTISAALALKYDVVVKRRDISKGLDADASKRIAQCFPALVRKNIITEVQQETAMSRVSVTANFKDLKDCQIIIDAVPDIMDLKIANFAELNKICPKSTIFTTASSLVSITALAAGSGRPDRVIGTHYNFPAHQMRMVEVAPALQTSQETIDFTITFLKDGLGKIPIKCKDLPGYIVNFIFFPFLIQAIRAVERGSATVEEVDTAIREGLGHRFGPFQLMDMFGNDSNVVAFRTLYEQLHDERFAPPTLLVKMAEAGHYGTDVGHGWYTYDEQGKQIGPTKIY